MGDSSALLSGLFRVLAGYQPYFYRKQQPAGWRVHAYSATDCVHGLLMLVLAAGCLLLGLVSRF